jgi:aldose 1-epimerase
LLPVVSISRYTYGVTVSGREVKATIIETDCLKAVVLDYGLRLVSMEWKSSDFHQRLIQGGWPLSVYEKDDAYHGAVVGRTCNRIAGGQLYLNGRMYQLDRNEGDHHLHGGNSGLHNRVWQVDTNGCQLLAQTRLLDGESGYPGNVDVRVSISLEQNALCYQYEAVSDQDTLFDVTNHAYFCLDQTESVLEHELQIFADYFVPVDEDLIPVGELQAVASASAFDLRSPQTVGRVLAQQNELLSRCGGIDHCWLLNDAGMPAAVLRSEISRIELSVFTSFPGLQVYSGNYLPTPHSAICLETQHLPDACHHESFDTPMLKAGERYLSWSRYEFTQS